MARHITNPSKASSSRGALPRILLMLAVVANFLGCGTGYDQTQAGPAGPPGTPGPVTGGTSVVFSPPPGAYVDSVTVTLSPATPGEAVDWVVPVLYGTNDVRDEKSPYSSPITLRPALDTGVSWWTLKAVAGAETNPTVASYEVTLGRDPVPVFTPGSGTFTSPQVVSISSSAPWASIYYTLDGTSPEDPPTPSTVLYTGPFTIDRPTVIKAVAAAGYSWTPVATATYSF